MPTGRYLEVSLTRACEFVKENICEPRKYDANFKGPIQNRGCTDIICCILFIVAIVAYFAVGILAWSQGDPRKVIYPTNSKGQFCGQAGTELTKPLLFYFNIMKCASPLVLLEFQCPTTQVGMLKNPTPSANFSLWNIQYILSQLNIFFYDYLLLNLPLVVCGHMSKPGDSVCLTCALLMCFLSLRKGIVHCYFEYAALKNEPGSNVTLQEIGFQTDFSVYLHIRQTWLAFMIILAIVEVIIILLLIFLRKRILLAIALIKEASRAIGHVMSSLFYPLLTFLLLAVVIAYWAVTAVFLSTSNQAIYKVFNETACEYSRQNCDPANFSTSNIKTKCPDSMCLFAFYGGETAYHKYLIGLQFYNVFLFFWCANFVTALGQMTLAGAFASYYWAFNKPKDIPACPIFASLGRALRYHTGSLAFGSLILAIIQVIRVLLEYLDYKLKGAQNKFAKFLLCCLKCCFWCLEKFIKFLNRNAYIMVAIYGKNFCTSARDAFFLLMRNVIRVAVLDKVTDFLLFLGKLLIVGLVGIFAFFFFSGRVKAFESTAPTLNYYWVPILVTIGSYLIAHGFFSVYAMCVDTLFLCFLEDLERNDGSAERPYLMPDSLLKILNKKNKTAAE
uniref:Choline transporter-like protein n=1 Tax=Denticeps clupeoides TaxID=299321 RepID=A0AAY4DSW9_9TELE